MQFKRPQRFSRPAKRNRFKLAFFFNIGYLLNGNIHKNFMCQVVGYPDANKLRPISKQPTYPFGTFTPRMTKRVADMRGPELVHNKLIHKQYAIVALSGGQMEYGHFNMIRNTINFNFDMTKTFALWRVDPPWKPITRHGQGFCLEKI